MRASRLVCAQNVTTAALADVLIDTTRVRALVMRRLT